MNKIFKNVQQQERSDTIKKEYYPNNNFSFEVRVVNNDRPRRAGHLELELDHLARSRRGEAEGTKDCDVGANEGGIEVESVSATLSPPLFDTPP